MRGCLNNPDVWGANPHLLLYILNQGYYSDLMVIYGREDHGAGFTKTSQEDIL